MAKLAAFAILAASLAGCALATEAEQGGNPPELLGVDRQALSVGEPLEIVGGNFLKGTAGYTEVRFDGVYDADDGSTHDVSMRIRPQWEDGNKLVWAQVGPFQVPFLPSGDQTGEFHGTLTAINVVGEKKEEFESEPIDIDLEILPSIILTKFEPIDAQCDAPSRVILGGFSYDVGVRAIGFEPVNFSYVVGGEPDAEAPRIYRHKAVGPADEFGDGGEINFERVGGDVPFYIGTLAVTSLGTDGEEHVLALSYGVHRAIEHILLNTVKVAEIEPATPVSGCHSGGQTNGRTVTWMESETDTRERSVGVTWDESWMEQQQNTQGGSTTTTNSIHVDVSQSQTNGWSMSYTDGRDISGGGSAGGSLFGLVEVSAEGKYTDVHRETKSYYGSSTKGYTVGRDHSESDTESWAFTKIQGHEIARGSSDFWTISSSDTTSTSFEGFILPGEYGVFYRQTTRLALPGRVVAYNKCGKPQVVAETNFSDYTWSIDLAQGDTCPPFPESDLPEAECFVAPCSTPE